MQSNSPSRLLKIQKRALIGVWSQYMIYLRGKSSIIGLMNIFIFLQTMMYLSKEQRVQIILLINHFLHLILILWNAATFPKHCCLHFFGLGKASKVVQKSKLFRKIQYQVMSNTPQAPPFPPPGQIRSCVWSKSEKQTWRTAKCC